MSRWVKFNPNPLGLQVGDCTVRAISAVTGKSWTQAHRELCDLSELMADMPSADRVWWEYLRGAGFSRHVLLDRCPACYTVRDFCRDHPRGVYILGPPEHAVAVIRGRYWDAWDSGETIPSYYFTREAPHEI